jgi:uncharacterized membrane protein YbhN (UPF0104 family)
VRSAFPRWIVWAFQIALTLAVTYFLFRSISLSWRELADVDLAGWTPRALPFAASCVVLLAVYVYLVGLWALMVRGLGGPRLGLGESIKIFFVANLGRYVPGKVWQLAGLTYLAGKRGVSLPVASSAAVLGQIFALAAAVAVGGIALAAGATSGFPSELVPWAVALAAIIVVVVTVPAALRTMLRVAFRLGRREEETPQLDAAFGARWLLLYLIAWLGYGIAFGLLWRAFPALPEVSWPAAVGSFAGAYFLGYAAIFAPAGIGVREGAMAVLLSSWMNATDATVLAVLSRLWMTAAELVPLALIAMAAVVRPKNRNAKTEDHAI